MPGGHGQGQGGCLSCPVRIFDIDADDPVKALQMEREENEHRLDLTPSEKVELARRIEESLAGRRGSNQYQQKGLPVKMPDTSPVIEKELPQNFGEAKHDTESSAIAAKAVGMNRETYRQAKAVVDSGNVV